MPAVIFVADDERAIRGSILKRLTRQGYHAVGYESGEGLSHQSPGKRHRLRMTTRGLCKIIKRGRAHDVVWQQIQYAGDDLLHLSRNFRPSDRELCVNFLGELGHTAKLQSPRRHSKRYRSE